MPGGDWLRAGPVGGCVMTPPADPRREPAAAVRCGGGSGGAEPGRAGPWCGAVGSGLGRSAQVGPAAPRGALYGTGAR